MKPGELVLVREHDSSVWELSIFAYEDADSSKRFVCINGIYWKECISYQGNERLLGTRGSASKFLPGQPVLVRKNKDDEWKLRYYNCPLEDGLHCVISDASKVERLPVSPVGDGTCIKEIWAECEPFENVIGKPFLDFYRKFAEKA